MLQHFIETKRSDSSPPQLATKDEIMVDSTIILGAGADTTSIVVQPILGDLAMHPRADSKLQFKIDQAYQGLSLTDRAAEISYNDAAKLPYLAPVIKQARTSARPSCTRCPAACPKRDYKFDRRIYRPDRMQASVQRPRIAPENFWRGC
jgi:hypothetical protein